eukprot:584667-Pyramimonas_sp.AAC.2
MGGDKGRAAQFTHMSALHGNRAATRLALHRWANNINISYVKWVGPVYKWVNNTYPTAGLDQSQRLK